MTSPRLPATPTHGLRILAAVLACALGCLFSGAETDGLPCERDGDCGLGQPCIEGVCGGPSRSPGSTGVEPTGGSGTCTVEDAICVDDATLRACIDSELVEISCAEACVPEPALGCGTSQAGLDTCVCNPYAPGACTSEGTIECVGTGGIQRCDGGTWEVFDCDYVCDDGESHYSIGCQFDAEVGGDVCLCPTAEPCEDGHLYCASSERIRLCSAGVWVELDCAEQCAIAELGESLGCVFVPDLDDDTCICVG